MEHKTIMVDYLDHNFDGGPTVKREVIDPGLDRFTYEISPDDAKDFLKMFWGKKTLLIPLDRVIRIEMTL